MSLDDWINSVILQQAAQTGVEPHADKYRSEPLDRSELAAVNRRLDDLTRRIEQVTHAGAAAYAPKHHRQQPDQRAELIGRLDQYLNTARQSQPRESRQKPPEPAPRVAVPPPLDRALAEITARQQVLKKEASRRPTAASTPVHPRTPLPSRDLSGLEEQLRKITNQIETLRRPGVEEAINALRVELGEIGHSLDEAMPRRAIDAIERQIQELTKRIVESRQNGADRAALAGIERGLGEVRDAVQQLTPAEKLVGFNEAIEGLAQKIDLIVAERNPATMTQLESAVTTLRGMVSHVASNEAVSALAAEVQHLTEKVDHLAHSSTGIDALNNLERRIDALGDALAERAHNGGAVSPRLEALAQSLSDKVEQIQNSRVDNIAVAALEDRIAALVERLDASDSRLGQLEAIERGLADLLAHIQQMQANRDAAAAANAIAPAPDNFAAEAIKQDLALSQDALKYEFAQAQEALRYEFARSRDNIKDDIARAQGTLNEVHGALGQLFDRLASIEQDIRSERQARPAQEESGEIAEPVRQHSVRLVHDAPAMQAPVAMDAEQPEALAVIGGVRGTAWRGLAAHLPSAPQLSPTAVTNAPEFAETVAAADALPHHASQRPSAADLSPDQPLEPGSGPPPLRANAAARIAASEAALGSAAPAVPASGGRSNFIAAARRAAQAALQQETAARSGASGSSDHADPSAHAGVLKRMKSLFVAASIVAIAVGSVQIAGNMLHWGKSSAPPVVKAPKAANKALPDTLPRVAIASPEKPASKPPMALAPPITSIDLLAPPNQTVQIGGASTQVAAPEVTGSIPSMATQPPMRQAASVPPADDHGGLPVAIGSQRLRNAAAAGDAAAAYEVAVRFAEGRGVPVDLPAAARWYERAAKQGLAPAQFRYGSMLEKGQGVEKDLAQARKFYLAAASQGNAKSMHNLAVLYSEGVDGKPDYQTAAKWFRKAARHGVSDSQYNLGILYARGIGVREDFGESYKWFALAAQHGDKEAAKKRDEVAAHLDPKQLAAARSAVEHFKAEPQPKQATTVAEPPGGWDMAAATPHVTAQAAPSHTVGKH